MAIRSKDELKIMAESGQITGRVLTEALEQVRPGVSTLELDQYAERRIRELGAEPGFKKVRDYSFTTCINLNEGLVHGLPSKDIVIHEGDLVSVDLGAFYGGFHTDAAWTMAVNGSQTESFLKAGKTALERAIAVCQPGNRVGDISAKIQEVIEKAGYQVIQALVGHGVGRELHEDPQIPCFGAAQTGPRLKLGMTLAIEVLYAEGAPGIVVSDDGWTVQTADGSLSAIFEKTIVIEETGPRVLTPIGWE